MKQNLYFLPKVKRRTAAQIHNMTRTVCSNPYTVGLAVKKPKALLHDPHDVSRLIKRCHTLRSQFADELNQDILFQGWLICAGGGSALVTDIQDKDNAVSAHMRQMQTRCSSYSYLISCSVFFLCSFSSVFWHLPLLLSVQPHLPTWGLQWWLQKAKFEVSGGCCCCFSCCASNSTWQTNIRKET